MIGTHFGILFQSTFLVTHIFHFIVMFSAERADISLVPPLEQHKCLCMKLSLLLPSVYSILHLLELLSVSSDISYCIQQIEIPIKRNGVMKVIHSV